MLINKKDKDLNQNNKLSKLETGLVDSISSDKLKEMSADTAEVILDELLNDGILKDIPVFGLIYKAGVTILNINDRLFAKKVFNFLYEIKDVDETKRHDFISKLEEKPKFQQKAGEAILMLLNKADHLHKPKLIGQLLKAQTEGNISIDDFLRLSHIVNNIYVEDLKSLRLYYKSMPRYDEHISDSLVANGLIWQSLIDGGTMDGDIPEGGSKYSITKLGILLIENTEL